MTKKKKVDNKEVPKTRKVMDRTKAYWSPKRKILINMELRNGDHTSFIRIPKTNSFKFEGGTYIIDPSYKYYHIASKTYALDYHQDCCIPIDRSVKIKAVKEAIDNKSEISLALNPRVLKEFVDSKVAEGVMRGQQIEEYIRKYVFWGVVGTIASVCTFLLLLYTSGVLDSLSKTVGV